jgi:DNA polymerase-3 subunit beta
MRFFVSQVILQNAINTVYRAINPKAPSAILTGIYLEAREDQTLKLIASDLKLGIEIDIPAEVEEPGSIVVNARLFSDIVRKLPSIQLYLEVKEHHLHIHADHSDFNLLIKEADEYPLLPQIETSTSITLDKGLFNDLIKKTHFAISTDETRPILTGALLELSNDRLHLVAVDGFRMAMKRIKIQGETDRKAVIPGKTLAELSKILTADDAQEEITLHLSDKHAFVTVDNVKLTTRLLEGEFINYREILPNQFKTEVTADAKALHDAVDRVALLAREGKMGSIKFEIDEHYLTLSSNVETGDATEKIRISHQGGPLVIGFNPSYILDVLKAIDSEKVLMRFNNAISPCILEPVDDDNFTNLVLPVRLAQ